MSNTGSIYMTKTVAQVLDVKEKKKKVNHLTVFVVLRDKFIKLI